MCIETVEVVSVAYSELVDPTTELHSLIEEAFGPSGLGILTVSGVPDLPALRHDLLHLSRQFAELPEEEKTRCTDPASNWNVGWSHGREALADGRRDVHKGSFYANPLHDEPTADPTLRARYPAHCRPNMWPGGQAGALRGAFRALGGLVVHVGCVLAERCDAYLAGLGITPAQVPLAQQLAASRCHKGRLLHYFPLSAAARSDDTGAAAQWCGWHTDFGTLTGADMDWNMACDAVTCPDPGAGLCIRDRAGRVVRAAIPPGCLAFQVGQAAQVHAGGLLVATPHCVRAAAAPGVARDVFAVFMQPGWDTPLQAPHGMEAALASLPHWAPGVPFGDYTERTVEEHYQAGPLGDSGSGKQDAVLAHGGVRPGSEGLQSPQVVPSVHRQPLDGTSPGLVAPTFGTRLAAAEC